MNIKRIGFPITINQNIPEYNLTNQLKYYVFLVKVLENLIDMDNEKEVKIYLKI